MQEYNFGSTPKHIDLDASKIVSMTVTKRSLLSDCLPSTKHQNQIDICILKQKYEADD
jgi:hypothetical protein